MRVGGVRAAGGSGIAGVIGDRLSRDDPRGLALLRRYADRLDPDTRHALGTAAGMLSTSLDSAAWVRDRSAALDAVNAVDATDPPPVVSSGGMLFDPTTASSAPASGWPRSTGAATR